MLLHDSLGCTALWRDFPDALARLTGHPVISYDRLGFGLSDAHPGVLGVDFVATEAQDSFGALLDALAIDRFMVFGHSVGGGMAVSIAAAYGMRCQAVITESAQSFVEPLTLDGIRAARDSFAAKAADGLNSLQKALPFLCAANAAAVVSANSQKTTPRSYVGFAV
ncbi:MAG: alpha/beta fold hydrolase, partial [Comamonas sp.]